MKRALLLANIFNLLIGIYFIVISIISLVHLRWYHQLTVAIRVKHIITSSTSYSSFIILLFESIILVLIFITNASFLTSKKYIAQNVGNNNSINLTTLSTTNDNNNDKSQYNNNNNNQEQQETLVKQRIPVEVASSTTPATGISDMMQRQDRIVFHQKTSTSNNMNNYCSTFLHLISSICLIAILVIWSLNTGELVRDSISTQLDGAFLQYQFANRSNFFSVAIDGMQDINNCCGSLDYTDFPHQRTSGLSSGHYPGSCCGKHIFGVNARVLCIPEEIKLAKQTVSNMNLR